jgi:hypothetical protein
MSRDKAMSCNEIAEDVKEIELIMDFSGLKLSFVIEHTQRDRADSSPETYLDLFACLLFRLSSPSHIYGLESLNRHSTVF